MPLMKTGQGCSSPGLQLAYVAGQRVSGCPGSGSIQQFVDFLIGVRSFLNKRKLNVVRKAGRNPPPGKSLADAIRLRCRESLAD